jgi:hypothetical protein
MSNFYRIKVIFAPDNWWIIDLYAESFEAACLRIQKGFGDIAVTFENAVRETVCCDT